MASAFCILPTCFANLTGESTWGSSFCSSGKLLLQYNMMFLFVIFMGTQQCAFVCHFVQGLSHCMPKLLLLLRFAFQWRGLFMPGSWNQRCCCWHVELSFTVDTCCSISLFAAFLDLCHGAVTKYGNGLIFWATFVMVYCTMFSFCSSCQHVHYCHPCVQ